MTQIPARLDGAPVTTERHATAPDNLGADAITATVLSQINAPDARIGQLASSLVTHLHDFIRENQVTWDEWMAGLDFLARVGHWTSPARNEFILMSDTSGSSTLVDALNNQGPANMTPTTVEGPFHSPAPPRQMGDVIAAEAQWARGDWTLMHGRVLDTDGNPVAGARIDIWQANQVGLYDVQDPAMQPGDLRALLTTGLDGRYWFRTVKPCPYPVPTDGPGGNGCGPPAASPCAPRTSMPVSKPTVTARSSRTCSSPAIPTSTSTPRSVCATALSSTSPCKTARPRSRPTACPVRTLTSPTTSCWYRTPGRLRLADADKLRPARSLSTEGRPA